MKNHSKPLIASQKTYQKIIRSGNSLAITIPSKFVKQIGIRSGDDAEVTTNPYRGKITVTFRQVRQLSFLK